MLFKVKAYQHTGGVILREYEAENAQAAKSIAENEGYSVLTVDAVRSINLKFSKPCFPLVLFTQELLSLLQAGLPLLGSIEALSKKERNSSTQKVYRSLVKLLREGKPLSAALSTFPDIFPALYIALVSASERTGDLPHTLERYLVYRGNLDAIRSKLTSAAIYPSLLLIVGGLVVVFLMTYVVPRFSQVYEDIGGDLPLMSRMLMEWGKFFKANGEIFLATSVMILTAAVYMLTRPHIREKLTAWFLQIPVIGEKVRLYELSRFYRTLGMLLNGGIAIRKAIEMSSGLLAMQQLRTGLARASQDVMEGKSVSDAMKRNDLSTDVADQMLSVGERSGNLGEMMERISRFHDDEIGRWMERFAKLFEPLLMALIGLIIGGIVLLMYLPIFELASSIQ